MDLLISHASAKVDSAVIGKALDPILNNIAKPIITLLFAVALIIFVWGIFEMIRDGGEASAREKGRWHILGGVIGMAIMVSAWGIVYFIASSVRSF